MTPEASYDKLAALADGMVADKRWQDQNDDLGMAILGMLLHGYALGAGRLIMMLDVEDIDAALTRYLIERVSVAAKWTGGLVRDASRSAFDKSFHPGQHELIGVGHQYMGEGEAGKLVGNVFANIKSVRRRFEQTDV